MFRRDFLATAVLPLFAKFKVDRGDYETGADWLAKAKIIRFTVQEEFDYERNFYNNDVYNVFPNDCIVDVEFDNGMTISWSAFNVKVDVFAQINAKSWVKYPMGKGKYANLVPEKEAFGYTFKMRNITYDDAKLADKLSPAVDEWVGIETKELRNEQ